MTITTTLKDRDAELRRLNENHRRVIREMAQRLEVIPLTITWDDAPSQTVELGKVLEWRDWSDREIEQLTGLISGNLKRVSTIDPNGNLCDLEVA